ncbi:MAG: PilX N-terminal domain-containing pilus assembly protein [Actinomycetota bacterium]
MRVTKIFAKGSKETSVPKEQGFALIVVLIALLMLSVLGAASLLLMVSSLKGMANMRPEDRAFQVAESGLYVAHAKIVNNEVRTPVTASGSVLGGDYSVSMQPVGGSTTDYVVVSEGSYVDGGTTYRRKLQENIYYSGDQAFDAMRNYLFFAGRDLNIDVGEIINVGVPITINGNMRAEEDVNISCHPVISLGDGLTINGSIEGKRSINVDVAPTLLSVRTNLFGEMRAGDALDASSTGTINLHTDGWLLAQGIIYAAATSSYKWDMYRTSLVERKDGPWDTIVKGNQVNSRGVDKVYVPEPNFDYYKAIAKDQGNYFEGDKTLSGNLGTYASSSVTVIYCTGNMTLNGFAWNLPNMKGILVCEGTFTANNTLQFASGSQFQVIANGDIVFNNDWSFLGLGSTNDYFFWSGNDAWIDLGMFSEQRLQVTALRDVNVFSNENLFATCSVTYKPPDIDVAGFPIDLTITNWKELPSE